MLDNLFLGRELSEASRLNRQLQSSIDSRRNEVDRLERAAANLQRDIGQQQNVIASITREKAQAARQLADMKQHLDNTRTAAETDLKAIRDGVKREKSRLLAQVAVEVEAHKTAELNKVSAYIARQKQALEAEHQTAIKNQQARLKELRRELKSASDSLKASHSKQQEELTREHTAELERLTQSHFEAVAGLDGELQSRRDELSRLDIELAEKWQGAKAELEARHAHLESELKAQAAELQTQLEAAIQDRRDELAGLDEEIKERWRFAEAEEEERIRIARRAFENEQQAAILQLRSEQIEAAEALKQSKGEIIEEYREALEAPLLQEIAALTMELGRIKKKISKDHMNWQPNQIREFFIKEREGKAEPTHVRLGGASESGKSYMINQLVSSGLKSMGVQEFDVVLLDPYGSDTKWDVKPAVYDDAEAAAAIVANWGENAKGDKLPRPTLLMIDEFDTLVAEFGLAQAVKDIVKLGRHRNRFLWMIGQSGNCPKGFTWTDVKNLNQLYLGSVAEDYVNNGLKGRNKNKFLGEIEALRDKSKFHAIVTPKDQNPYTVLIPSVLFPGTAAAADTGLKCPKCGSENVRKDGTYKYKGAIKQRLKCGACGKGSSIESEHV